MSGEKKATVFVSLGEPYPSATNVHLSDERVTGLIEHHRAEGWPCTDLRPKAPVVLIHPRPESGLAPVWDTAAASAADGLANVVANMLTVWQNRAEPDEGMWVSLSAALEFYRRQKENNPPKSWADQQAAAKRSAAAFLADAAATLLECWRGWSEMDESMWRRLSEALWAYRDESEANPPKRPEADALENVSAVAELRERIETLEKEIEDRERRLEIEEGKSFRAESQLAGVNSATDQIRDSLKDVAAEYDNLRSELDRDGEGSRYWIGFYARALEAAITEAEEDAEELEVPE